MNGSVLRYLRGRLRIDFVANAPGGFTLIELLVVIAIIAVLAGLLLGGVARAKVSAEGAKCQNNLKEFGYAWAMYSHDNEDHMPPNLGGKNVPHEKTWVRGWLDPNVADDTNTFYLQESHLGPFLSALQTWRCPGDKSVARLPSGVFPRVRSVSMNHFLNPSWPDTPDYRTFKSLGEIAAPDSVFTFLDEREDSINDGSFAAALKFHASDPGTWTLADFPGNCHRQSGVFTFADGHVELHKWKDPRTQPPLKKGGILEKNILSPNNPDVAWLEIHETTRDD